MALNATQGSLVARSARIALTTAVSMALLLFALLALESSGPSPVHPLGQNISSSQPAASGADAPQIGSDGNPNGHCKPHGFPGCRPPSGP